ncbi:MAG: hypothetical protein AAB463_01300 [Patescibacteria group bacterium]
MQLRYWLQVQGCPKHEVTRERFIQAERNAGFYPKSGSGDVLATGGFSSGDILGSITYEESAAEKKGS